MENSYPRNKIYDGKLEKRARKMIRCMVCGKPKKKGLLVCWDCFKHRKENPLKDFNGSFGAWLNIVSPK